MAKSNTAIFEATADATAVTALTEAIASVVEDKIKIPNGVSLIEDEALEFLAILPEAYMIKVVGKSVYGGLLDERSKRPYIGSVFIVSAVDGATIDIEIGKVSFEEFSYSLNEQKTALMSHLSYLLKQEGKKFDQTVFAKAIADRFCYKCLLEKQEKRLASQSARLAQQSKLKEFRLPEEFLKKHLKKS